jgi:hypothetical protein
VQIDVSGRAIIRVLIQEKHLVSFKSWKLNDVKKKKSTHEKKMTVIVLNSKEYRVYMLGPRFIINKDNVVDVLFKM